MLPMVGVAVAAGVGLFFWLRHKPEEGADLERDRRAYLNRVGRIVEGQILEIVDHTVDRARDPKDSRDLKPAPKSAALFNKHALPAGSNGTQLLLYYTYSISGVTYETAQDVTGLEEQAHLGRIAAGQTASVKYDPSNPSNSILLADDWSGLH